MNTNDREYRTVVLAALLHDIGKLFQRGSFSGIDIAGKHPAISANFVRAFKNCFDSVCDSSLLETLVQKHHESYNFEPDLNIQSIVEPHTRTLASLVSLADNLSSAERGESTANYQHYKNTPLASVLERIDNLKQSSPEFRIHAAPLTPPTELNSTFPEAIQHYQPEELTRLIQSFGQEFYEIFVSGQAPVNNTRFDDVLTHLYSLLAKYAWCLPGNTQEVFPDVSLFDHLRTTSAIASCLYLYHAKENSLNEDWVRGTHTGRFLLVAGDISGIQNYIFDIASGQAGGIARRLRARSFYVQMCSEVAAHRLLRKLELPLVVHTLMNTGGHFYLLLPNIEEARASIRAIQRELDDWFLTMLNGELALNLAAAEFDVEGFQKQEEGSEISTGFGSVIEKVNAELDVKKKNRFSDILQANGIWQEASFNIATDFKGEDSCQSCRKYPQESEGLCAHCYLDLQIGRKLPQAKYIAFYDNTTGGDIPVLGFSLSIDKSTPAPYLVTKINDTTLADLTAFPAIFKYLAKTVPAADDCEVCRRDESRLATFECIAGHATGDKLLGFLKMDIDNLGETVIYGLKPGYDSISRIITFSRMLDMFFAGYIEGIARQYKEIYIVFSGGDDVFLVGPWDLILETAGFIRAEFLRYTHNQRLSLSAGIAINNHDYPFSAAAREVNEALNAAKASAEKDSITVLGHTLRWQEWQKIAEEWHYLRDVVNREKATSAILHNLLAFAGMWQRYRQGDIRALRYHPLLSYYLRRNVSPKNSPELYKWLENLLAIRPGDKNQTFLLDNLGLLTQLTILSKRS